MRVLERLKWQGIVTPLAKRQAEQGPNRPLWPGPDSGRQVPVAALPAIAQETEWVEKYHPLGSVVSDLGLGQCQIAGLRE